MHQTLSCPLTSAARRRAATTAPAARCLVDPQPSFEPMANQEEPVMTVGEFGGLGSARPVLMYFCVYLAIFV